MQTTDLTDIISDATFWDELAQAYFDEAPKRKFQRSMLTRGQRHLVIRLWAKNATESRKATCLRRSQYRVMRALEKLGFVALHIGGINNYAFGYYLTATGQEYVRRFVTFS
jgi:hypothetical protein